jgi:hypothetical protein
VRLAARSSALIAVLLAGCAAQVREPTPSLAAPGGLDPDRVLLAIDYLVHDPVVDGVYDPRIVTLTADGTLVLQRPDLDALMSASATKLDPAGLRRALGEISSSGVVADGDLDLPGFASQTVTTTTTRFRVDDGTRSSELSIFALGSELIYPGVPPISADEMTLRASATRLIEDLRSMGDLQPWTPPALLLWWRPARSGDTGPHVKLAPAVPMDLATAGRAVKHPVWDRCARLDGHRAEAVAALGRSLPIDGVVEQAGRRHALQFRPIHADESAAVSCR